MPVYARADVDYVGISREGGGCGEGHARPVIQGAPVRVWRLDCPPCSAVLRKDGQWSGTIAEIPETPDETLAREDLEKRGAQTQQQVLAVAMAKLAGMPEAAGVLQSLAGAHALPAAPSVACPEGHDGNAAGAKFCAECGTAMPVPAPLTVTCPAGHETPPGKFCGECGMSLAPAVAEPPGPAPRRRETPQRRRAKTA